MQVSRTSPLKKLEIRLLDWLPSSVRARLRGAHAANKAIVRSAFWLALFVAAAKVVAAGKEIAVAYRYGTSATVEGYLFVFNLLSWPVSLLFSVMSAVFIPRLVALQRDDPEGAVRWQRQVTAWVWLLGTGLGIGVAVGFPPLLATDWLGLEAQAMESAQAVLPWLAGMVTLGIVAGWHACQLMSRQRHANTFLEAMPALAIGVAVLGWPAGPDVNPLLWGTLVGFALQATLLIWVVRMAGAPPSPAWPPGRPFQRGLLGSVGWLLAGQFVMGAAGVVDQILLAHMPSGNLAAYGYANRVMALALTLSATVIGRAFLPVLAAEADARLRLELTRRWAWRLFWLGAIAAGVLTVLAEPMVALLFERGMFSPEDTRYTAWLLRLLALQLPFYIAGIVWVQCILIWPNGTKTLYRVALMATGTKVLIVIALYQMIGLQAEAVCWGVVAGYLVTWLAFMVRTR